MKEELKRLLDPPDDGRAFTDAVLFQASGALYRRRAAADASAPAWEWLARWARPWVVAALALVAMIAFIPLRPGASQAAAQPVPADSEIMSAALLPPDLAVTATTEVIQER